MPTEIYISETNVNIQKINQTSADIEIKIYIKNFKGSLLIGSNILHLSDAGEKLECVDYLQSLKASYTSVIFMSVSKLFSVGCQRLDDKHNSLQIKILI